MSGDVPAGVSSDQIDNVGGFLNIQRRGIGSINLSARQDHNVLNMTTQNAAAAPDQLNDSQSPFKIHQ